ALNTRITREKRDGLGFIPDLYPVFFRRIRQPCDEPRPASHSLDRQPAPELELTADIERLPSPGGGEADAFLAHPFDGRQRILDEKLGQVWIAAVFGDAPHVVEELLLGVGAEIRARDLLGREIRNRLLQIVDARVGDAKEAGGEARVAARDFL